MVDRRFELDRGRLRLCIMPLHAPNAQTRDDNALALVLFPRIDTINFVSPRLAREPRRWIRPIDSFDRRIAAGYSPYYFR